MYIHSINHMLLFAAIAGSNSLKVSKCGRNASLGIVLDVADVWNIAGEFVQAYLMYEVPTHGVKEVGVLVDYILIIEEEFVWLQQLLLFYIEHVLFDVVAHDLVVFHVIIGDGLAAKHYEVVGVNHVQAD